MLNAKRLTQAIKVMYLALCITPLALSKNRTETRNSEEPEMPETFYTSQILTAFSSEAKRSSLVLRAGINSCATYPLNPVSIIAFIIAG
jgi:hypothetical protein